MVLCESTTFTLSFSNHFAGRVALLIFLIGFGLPARAQSSQTGSPHATDRQNENAVPCVATQVPKRHKSKRKIQNKQPCNGSEQSSQETPQPPPQNPAAVQGQKEEEKPADPWAESIKVLAEGGLALVSLTFAAFTFLYSSLLAIKEDQDQRAMDLRNKLRYSLYATAITVSVSSILTFFAFWTMLSGGRVLTVVTIILAILILLAVPGITLYLIVDAATEHA